MKQVKRQLGFLFYGLIIWFPVGIFIFLVVALFGSVDSAMRSFLGLFMPTRHLVIGSGFALSIVIVYATGLVLETTPASNTLAKIPWVGTLFARRKGGAMSMGALMKMNPCLFLFSPSCPSYGWVLSEEQVVSPDRQPLWGLVHVYYPNVPTLVMGQVYPVRKESVILLGNKSSEVIDLLLYSLRSPEFIVLMPWPDESREGFAARVARFGLTPEAPSVAQAGAPELAVPPPLRKP